jgi:hypothetical protein
MPRKRKPLRLGRLRKSVAINNRIYGLLVQAVDALRGEHVELLNRVQHLERLAGLRYSVRDGAYHTLDKAAL